MATTQRTDANLPPNSAVNDALAHVVSRLRIAQYVRLVSRGALIGVVLSLVAVGLSHWNFLPHWLPLALLISVFIVFGIGIGAIAAATRPFDQMGAARLVEARLGLKERLSSALEFERDGIASHDPEAALLLRLQQDDAAAHAQAFQASEAVPINMPWEAKALVPAIILLILALVLPRLPLFVPPAERAERAVVRKSGDKIAQDAKAIEKHADAKGLTATKSAAQKMQELGQSMSQGQMDKKQAMVKMSQLSKEMADQQRRLAQESGGGAGGQADKSLAQAGQQLEKSLKQPAGTGQKSPAKAGTDAGEKGSAQAGSPEIQKAAKSLQQGSSAGLSEPLRKMVQNADSGKSSDLDKKQAAAELQKLANALQGTSESEAQRHIQAAADAMKRGDEKAAADQIRQAVDAANRETQRQEDSAGMQGAQQSLQDRQQQMAQAGSPGDIQDSKPGSGSPGAKPGSAETKPGTGSGKAGSVPGNAGKQGGKSGQAGQGKPGGPSQRGGAPGNGGDETGNATPTKSGSAHSGPGPGAGEKTPSQGTGITRGAPHPLDPKFNPAKNPNYGKIYLGGDNGGSGGKLGPEVKSQPGKQTHTSSVPYYNELAPARKTAESAMDKEEIPPSYRANVRRYFDSLRPSAGKPGK